MDRTTVEQLLEAAGPGGRLTIRFRDHLVPQLDENAEAVHEMTPKLDDAGNAVTDDAGNTVMVPEGPVIHVQDEAGIMRTISAAVVQIIDNHIALGVGPGKPIDRLIAFSDIDAIRPDPADHDAAVITAGPSAPAATPASADAAPTPPA
jgi:hypothetical protein